MADTLLDDIDEFNRKLTDWLIFYNTVRHSPLSAHQRQAGISSLGLPQYARI
jgi:hypothetical protein